MDDSLNKTSELTAKVALNPLMDVLYSDLFPDVLQNYNSEQTKELLSLLVDCPNNIINKKGPLGGYTALHWMAIKNDLENMDQYYTGPLTVGKYFGSAISKSVMASPTLMMSTSSCRILCTSHALPASPT